MGIWEYEPLAKILLWRPDVRIIFAGSGPPRSALGAHRLLRLPDAQGPAGVLITTIYIVATSIIITIHTGVCKINARFENTRYESQPPVPEKSMLAK